MNQYSFDIPNDNVFDRTSRCLRTRVVKLEKESIFLLGFVLIFKQKDMFLQRFRVAELSVGLTAAMSMDQRIAGEPLCRPSSVHLKIVSDLDVIVQ